MEFRALSSPRSFDSIRARQFSEILFRFSSARSGVSCPCFQLEKQKVIKYEQQSRIGSQSGSQATPDLGSEIQHQDLPRR